MSRWFVQYNPLYVFSASCMLGGVFLISAGLERDETASHLLVAALVQAYHFMLVGAAALLLRRSTDRRPAVMVGLIAAAFLFDPAMCAERTAGSFPLAAAHSILGVVKAILLGAAFRLRGAPRLALVVCLFAMPLAPYLIESFGSRDCARETIHLALTWGSAGLFAWLLHASRRDSWGSTFVESPWARAVLRRIATVTPFLVAALLAVHIVAWSLFLSLTLTPAHAAGFVLVGAAAIAIRLRPRWRAETVAWLGTAASVALASRGAGPLPYPIAPEGAMLLIASTVLLGLVWNRRLRLELPAMLAAYGGFVLNGWLPPSALALASLAVALLLPATILRRSLSCLCASAAAAGCAVARLLETSVIPPPYGVIAAFALIVMTTWLGAWTWLVFKELRELTFICTCVLAATGAVLMHLPDFKSLLTWQAGMTAIALSAGSLNRHRGYLVAGAFGAISMAERTHALWMPSSSTGWGTTAVAAAFILLAAGVTINLKRGASPRQAD